MDNCNIAIAVVDKKLNHFMLQLPTTYFNKTTVYNPSSENSNSKRCKHYLHEIYFILILTGATISVILIKHMQVIKFPVFHIKWIEVQWKFNKRNNSVCWLERTPWMQTLLGSALHKYWIILVNCWLKIFNFNVHSPQRSLAQCP